MTDSPDRKLYKQKWYLKNKEKVNKRAMAWQKKNRSKVNALQRKYRAIKKEQETK